MNEFWLWFWRPVAEFLGVIAFIATFLVVGVICMFFYWLFIFSKERIKGWRKGQ